MHAEACTLAEGNAPTRAEGRQAGGGVLVSICMPTRAEGSAVNSRELSAAAAAMAAAAAARRTANGGGRGGASGGAAAHLLLV